MWALLDEAFLEEATTRLQSFRWTYLAGCPRVGYDSALSLLPIGAVVCGHVGFF